MQTAKDRVRTRVRNGIAFIRFYSDIATLQRVDTDRLNMKDYMQCALAQATGLRYAEAVKKCGLTREQEVSYGFAIDPTEPDIFFEDLTAAWIEEIRLVL